MGNTYYEQKSLWGRTLESVNKEEQKRVKIILEFIPSGVESVLDVGCGDGLVTNILNERYNKVVGLDSSSEALSHVKSESILASCYLIPFNDNSFDLVLCNNVLEHLPFGVYERTLENLSRVSKKYVLISVPFNEDLWKRQIKCDRCQTVFHIYNHIKSFKHKDLESLSVNLKLTKFINCGIKETQYSELLDSLAKAFGRWETYEKAICPACGKNDIPLRKSRIGKCFFKLNRFFNFVCNRFQKRYYQVVCLYEKL